MRANISWVTHDLAVGGDLAYSDQIALKQAREILKSGITHVVDMRSEANDASLWESFGVAYKSLGTDDRTGHVVDPAIFDAGVHFARLAARSSGKVLAHCHMGINRGPSMGFAILLDRGYPPIAAFDMIRSARPEAFIAYARDALVAHAARQHRKGVNVVNWQAEAIALERHIEETMTLSKVGYIQRIMRTNRAADRDIRSPSASLF